MSDQQPNLEKVAEYARRAEVEAEIARIVKDAADAEMQAIADNLELQKEQVVTEGKIAALLATHNEKGALGEYTIDSMIEAWGGKQGSKFTDALNDFLRDTQSYFDKGLDSGQRETETEG